MTEFAYENKTNAFCFPSHNCDISPGEGYWRNVSFPPNVSHNISCHRPHCADVYIANTITCKYIGYCYVPLKLSSQLVTSTAGTLVIYN